MKWRQASCILYDTSLILVLMLRSWGGGMAGGGGASGGGGGGGGWGGTGRTEVRVRDEEGRMI
jgi:hypothetical protein